MSEFRSVQLGVVDSAGRNPRDDRHYFGLVRSVVIGVQRMVAACRDEGEKEDAVGLLMAMSLLHGSETPVRLFCGEAALTKKMMHRMRTSATHATAASVPFRPLEVLVRSVQARVKDYIAGSNDAPVASTPTQVCTGDERSCGQAYVFVFGWWRLVRLACAHSCACDIVFVPCRQGFSHVFSGTCRMILTSAWKEGAPCCSGLGFFAEQPIHSMSGSCTSWCRKPCGNTSWPRLRRAVCRSCGCRG